MPYGAQSFCRSCVVIANVVPVVVLLVSSLLFSFSVLLLLLLLLLLLMMMSGCHLPRVHLTCCYCHSHYSVYNLHVRCHEVLVVEGGVLLVEMWVFVLLLIVFFMV